MELRRMRGRIRKSHETLNKYEKNEEIEITYICIYVDGVKLNILQGWNGKT